MDTVTVDTMDNSISYLPPYSQMIMIIKMQYIIKLHRIIIKKGNFS